MRLFIALPVPFEIALATAALLPELPGLRRVRPALLHLTLAFVGHVVDDRLADVIAACTDAAAAQRLFPVTLDHGGCFPERGAPRVLWVGMGEGATECASLAAAVRIALKARDVPFDDKPFRPHVTLARAKPDLDRTAARAIAAAAAALRPPQLQFTAEAIVSFESVLSPKGPRYTPRAVVPLSRASTSA